MKNILLILFFGFSFIINGQPGTAKIIEKDGKQYYEHYVKKGQTAYGISKIYNININELFQFNPEAEVVLDIGQVVLIPIKEKVENNLKSNDKNRLEHTIQEGDTYWSISKKYGVDIKTILSANNDSIGELQIGNILLIPSGSADTSNIIEPIIKNPVNPFAGPCDSIIIHKVSRNETFYSISIKYNIDISLIQELNEGVNNILKRGAKIRIKLKKVGCIDAEINIKNTQDSLAYLDSIKRSIKKEYNVVLMLPLFLDKSELDKEFCVEQEERPFTINTIQSLDLYQGVLVAIDSLINAGLNINLYVHDTKNDTAVVNTILKDSNMKNMDLIIPLANKMRLKLILDYGKYNNIHVVCPNEFKNQALFNNQNLTKLIPSRRTQISGMAKYILNRHTTDNILLVENRKRKDDINYSNLFRSTYNENLNDKQDSINIISLSHSSKLTFLKTRLIKDNANIIVVPSTDEGFVASLITKLIGVINTYEYKEFEIIVFGLDKWLNMDNLSDKDKNRFSLHVVVPGRIIYNDNKIIDFITNYREKYKSDPGKFSFLGFDAAFFSLKGLMLYGTDFPKHYNKLLNKGYYLDMDFQQVDHYSGYENKNVTIIKYNDYNVIKVD